MSDETKLPPPSSFPQERLDVRSNLKVPSLPSPPPTIHRPFVVVVFCLFVCLFGFFWVVCLFFVVVCLFVWSNIQWLRTILLWTEVGSPPLSPLCPPYPRIAFSLKHSPDNDDAGKTEDDAVDLGNKDAGHRFIYLSTQPEIITYPRHVPDHANTADTEGEAFQLMLAASFYTCSPQLEPLPTPDTYLTTVTLATVRVVPLASAMKMLAIALYTCPPYPESPSTPDTLPTWQWRRQRQWRSWLPSHTPVHRTQNHCLPITRTWQRWRWWHRGWRLSTDAGHRFIYLCTLPRITTYPKHVANNDDTADTKGHHHQHHLHHHLSLNREGHWGTKDDFPTSFLHSSLFSSAPWDLAISRPLHSLMFSFHFFLCLPCLLPPFTVPCEMVLARPDERETWPYHCSLRLFTMLRWSSCGPIAYWILAQTTSLVTRSLYKMRSTLR